MKDQNKIIGLNGKISMRKLKEVVREMLPARYPLRVVVLAEKNTITGHEFLAKNIIWLRLMSWEKKYG